MGAPIDGLVQVAISICPIGLLRSAACERLKRSCLGAVEGLTEFLPISSTGHLTVVEKLLGFQIDDADITAFTAIIQSGAVLATLLFFRRELWGFLTAWVRGVLSPADRMTPTTSSPGR